MNWRPLEVPVSGKRNELSLRNRTRILVSREGLNK
ncbi:unnamed protein product [Medioppia subpectinata]|uniref:Uncharacterized protein n=1 Tax=Medioppia subpectinata TaxID=1979941 RepID=A0A7R9QKQ1_9ACAR|nr:unnamed protein product [Medioppia subpectinata]CAG2121976.1 unnamed protein product [Medioppia subpectinata]